MEEDQQYKYLQSIDPTKIHVPIRERFAKLTLSSNKKKVKQNEVNTEIPTEQLLAQRKRVSRSLLSQLEQSEGRNKSTNIMNPILRTDSSSTVDALSLCGDCESDDESLHVVKDTSLPHHKHAKNNDADLENQVDVLSQQISCMAMITPTVMTKNLPTVVSNEITIELSSESNSLKSEPQESEYDENEDDDDDDDEDDIITISDASSIQNAYLEPCDRMITSAIRESTEANTGQSFLPSTFSNDKADRIEAFLHDVSQQCRILAALQSETLADSSSIELPEDEQNTQKMHRAKELAAADTLSMIDFDSIEEDGLNNDNKWFNHLQDTPKSKNFSLIALRKSMARQSIRIDTNQSNNININHLLLDDTKVNTTNCTDYTYSSSKNVSAIIPENESIMIPDTDDENENEQSTHSDGVSIKDNHDVEENQPNNEIISSNKDSQMTNKTMNSDCANTTETSSDQSIVVSNVNISAKIKIKIQISEVYEESDKSGKRDDDWDGDDDDDGGGDDGDDENDDTEQNENLNHSSSMPTSENNSKEKTSNDTNGTVYKHKMNIEKTDITTKAQCRADNNNPDQFVNRPDQDKQHLMTYAEKLLTQLYGKECLTPEVRSTLSRTIANDKGNAIQNESTSILENTQKENNKMANDDSHLGDFSIFRRQRMKTATLESTRIMPPPETPIFRRHQAYTEPRQRRKAITVQSDQKSLTKKKNCENFEPPQTEYKPRRAPRTCANTMKSQPTPERWRHLVDPDSDINSDEGDNASDDLDADATEYDNNSDNDNDNKSDVDPSWSAENEDSAEKPIAKTKTPKKRKDKLIYLDLSQQEVTILEGTPPGSPLSNNDIKFQDRLAEILRTCRIEEKPKVTLTMPVSKRKLFTPNFGYEIADENDPEQILTPTKKNDNANVENEILDDTGNVGSALLPKSFRSIYDKRLGILKRGDPIFPIRPPQEFTDGSPSQIKTGTKLRTDETTATTTPTTPKITKIRGNVKKSLLDEVRTTPNFKYSFLKSLDVYVSKVFCHPDALPYRDNYRNKKEELANMLYDLYNRKLFDNSLSVPLVWNKKLSNTAGRCLNRKRMGVRSCVVELSDKVLTSADRLRCTLVHELCHAATWIFQGENGHGTTWKAWAHKANSVFPELPKIGVCHQYDIEYKYTYKCTLCSAKSYAHSKSKKVESIRCSYCHGAIEIFLNKKDKDGNILPTPVREPTGFAKFVKDNYKQYRKCDMKHADVMKILSNEFSALKVNNNKK